MLSGAVVLEDHDQIDGFERGKRFGASFRRIDGPARSLQPRGGGVTVEDNETVAGSARFGQQLDVAAMQPLVKPMRRPRRRHSASRSSSTDQSNTILIFRRERGGRQDAVAQFAQ